MVEVFPADSLDRYLHIRYGAEKIELITEKEILTGNDIAKLDSIDIYPATHYLAPSGRFEQALKEIGHDLDIS